MEGKIGKKTVHNYIGGTNESVESIGMNMQHKRFCQQLEH